MNSRITRFTLLGLLAMVMSFSTACTRIEPGYGGIVVDLNGGDKGVDDIVVETGRIFYSPFGKAVYQLPHFTQRVVWTLDPQEGSPKNQEITFGSVEGTVIKSDVGFAWSVKKDSIPEVFVKFRTNVGTIEDGYMRSQVRGAITACSEDKPLELLYGAGKTQVTVCALERMLTVPFINDNFDIEYLTFIGAFRYDPAVQTAINTKITAENEADAREKAAVGIANAAREVAQGEADALRTVSIAERDAKFAAAEGNLKLQKSLTPAVLRYQEIEMYREKWSGNVAKVQMGSGGGALLNFSMDD